MLAFTKLAMSASYMDDIKRSDILLKIKQEYSGQQSLTWLNLEALDTVITDDGMLIGIASAQVLTERFTEFHADSCPNQANNYWSLTCLNRLKKLQRAFSSFQKEWFEELESKALTSILQK
jgi:hypothetical protein